ncbi:MAG: DUF1194 domain-containing protein [Pseudomonadota bacterium]
MIRALLAALAVLFPGPAQAECRLALALALDISSSVNSYEYDIQLGGIVRALAAPDIREAILAVPGASVHVTVYEWSGYVQQDVIAPWTALDSPADIDALAARLATHRRIYSDFPTAIGKALDYGRTLFDLLPVACTRRVIDISGDGVNNDGNGPGVIQESGRLAGITVNALVIKGAIPDPEAYYRDHVIHGPGAFLIVARNGFEDYPELIRGKLLRELAPQLFIGALEAER